jgi:hypothetical protein
LSLRPPKYPPPLENIPSAITAISSFVRGTTKVALFVVIMASFSSTPSAPGGAEWERGGIFRRELRLVTWGSCRFRV